MYIPPRNIDLRAYLQQFGKYFHKTKQAGHYFGIEVRHVPLAADESMQPDLAQLERAIDSNTIMVSGCVFLANYYEI